MRDEWMMDSGLWIMDYGLWINLIFSETAHTKFKILSMARLFLGQRS